jgi:carboxymethylenebutenolidase
MGKIVSLTAADGHQFEAYSAEPAGEAKGGLVVIQEIYGVNEHIRAVCDDYAARGFRVLAPALYDRQQRQAEFGYDPDLMPRIRALRGGIDWEKLPLDVAATIAALRPLRVGMVGYCLGGSVTWLAACRLGIDAGACYYPTDIAKQLEEKPRSPVIVHFAERDHIITPDIVERFKTAQPQIPTHIYPAGHGFNCWHRRETSYDEPSAALALKRTLELFDRYVVQPR